MTSLGARRRGAALARARRAACARGARARRVATATPAAELAGRTGRISALRRAPRRLPSSPSTSLQPRRASRADPHRDMALALPHPAPPGPSPGARRAPIAAGRPARRHAAARAVAARRAGVRAGGGAARRPRLRAGSGPRPDQGRPRRRRGAARARGPRAPSRAPALAYTLESHALLGLGRAAEAVECLRALPADVAARQRPPRLARRRAAALQSPRGGDPLVLRRAGAEDGRRALALPPRHVVQGARHEGRGRRMRAHRDRARPRQQRRSRRAASSPSSSARRAAGPPPTRRMAGLRARRSRAAGRHRRSRPAPFRTPCWSTIRSSSSKVARHYALHVAAAVPAAAAARGARATTGACASATSRPTSTSTRPAS